MQPALVADAVNQAIEPALTTLAQSVLGAITLVAVGVAIWAVKKLSSVQDARAKDAQHSADKAEDLVLKMVTVQGESQRTLDAFVQAERQAEQVSREQTVLLQQIKQQIDTTIRDAVLRGRGYTPPPGSGRY